MENQKKRSKSIAGEEQFNNFIKLLLNAKKPREKNYTRDELLDNEKFITAIRKLQTKGFSIKQICNTVREFSQQANFSRVLNFNEKEINAMLNVIASSEKELKT